MRQAILSANGTTAGRLGRWRLGRCGLAEFIGLSLVGVFLALFEAFDAEHGALWQDLVYWQMAMLGGGVIAALIEPPLHRRLGSRPRLFAVVQTLAMTPPITAWIWLLANLFHGLDWRLGVILPIAGSVLVVNTAVIILAWLLRAMMAGQVVAAPPATSEAAPSEIRAKLPPRLARARLIAVQAEDHYLRVHTEAGSDLVLMKFGDALSALGGHDGLQVHRSWWVARRSVDAVRWRKGRGALTLEGGLEAPVSETYAAAVRATDWA